MNYINAAEYLKQSNRIQMNLKKWFIENIEPFDLCEVQGDIKFIKDIDKPKNEIIPIFDETKLRCYLEEKYNGKIEARYNAYGYTIHFLILDAIGGPNEEIDCIETSETDLIKAYWRITCMTAKNDDSHGYPVWEDKGDW